MQAFISQHPESERVKEANDIIDKCRAKLEQKDFENARLYYNLRATNPLYLKAATITFNILMNTYPDSQKSDEYKLYIIRSEYEYAVLSLEERKQVRFEQVVTDYPRIGGEPLGNVLPCRRVSLLEPDTSGAPSIRPEVAISRIERRTVCVAEREYVRLDRQPSGVDRPRREAFPTEACTHLVLVKVEQGVDTIMCEPCDGVLDRVDVGVRDRSGSRLERRVDDAQPYDVEPVARKRAGRYGTETGSRGLVWRAFGDHVQTVDDHDLAIAVREPPSRVADEDCRHMTLLGRGRVRNRVHRRGGRAPGGEHHQCCDDRKAPHELNLAGRGRQVARVVASRGVHNRRGPTCDPAGRLILGRQRAPEQRRHGLDARLDCTGVLHDAWTGALLRRSLDVSEHDESAYDLSEAAAAAPAG